MATLLHVCARFLGADGRPPAPGLTAVLMDHDPLADDRLAEAPVEADGSVSFRFELEAASSADSPLELAPDLYVVVLRDGRELHRTELLRDVDFLSADPVTGHRDRTTRDLGTLRLPA